MAFFRGVALDRGRRLFQTKHYFVIDKKIQKEAINEYPFYGIDEE